MKRFTTYDSETRLAYQNEGRARAYKARCSEDITWARFMMWRECFLVEKVLRQCHFKPTDRVLDIPCGTGVLSRTLRRFPGLVIASDISREMMALTHEDYRFDHFQGFVQSDILTPPFPPETFACVITVGLLHRLPKEIRRRALREITLLSNRYLVVSNSIDSSMQRWKQGFIRYIRPSHCFAPSPIPLETIYEEFKTTGLHVIAVYRPFPLLSADAVFFLEKLRNIAT